MSNISVKLCVNNCSWNRYLELVHPLWHRMNFKKSWVFIGIGINWIYGIAIVVAHHVPTSKVKIFHLREIYCQIYRLNSNNWNVTKLNTRNTILVRSFKFPVH